MSNNEFHLVKSGISHPENSYTSTTDSDEHEKNSNYKKSIGNGPILDESKYKTELCKQYELNKTCRYGNKCKFAHGTDELQI